MSFEVSTEIVIRAPRAAVWHTLVEVERWKEWSRWLRWEGGEVRVGGKLALRLTPPDGGGYAFRPEVIAAEPERHFAWVGRTLVRGVFDGEHHFVLDALDDGRTRLSNWERYSGLLSPLFQRLPMMKSAKPGFESMNEEIRARAEALAAEGRS